MQNELKLELSQEKTLITHISKGVKFLGYIISRRTVFTKQHYGLLKKLLTKRMNIPTLDVNMKKVITKLSEAGYCDKAGQPVPNFKLLQMPQSESNMKVNNLIQGLGA